jgi:multiple sugar transport system permease protein
MSYRAKRVIAMLVVHAVAWAIALIWIVPFFGLAMTSVRPFPELIDGWWHLDPLTPTLANFLQAWDHPDAPLSVGVRNSFLVAVPATIIPMFVGALGAYGFARFSLPLKNLLFVTTVIVLTIPAQMVVIPLFSMFRSLGMLDTLTALIIVNTVWALPWITLFLRNFIQTIPAELEEAARIDGASDFTVFARIILPVSIPALVSVAVLQFMWAWNDFFWALVFTFTPDKMVAVRQLPLLRGVYFIDWGILAAASVMVLAVPVALFALLQRYYIRGMVGWTPR